MSRDAIGLWETIDRVLAETRKMLRPRREYVGSVVGHEVTLGAGAERVPRLVGPRLGPGAEVLTLGLDDKRRIALGPVLPAGVPAFVAMFPITHAVATGGPYSAYMGPSTAHPVLGGVGAGTPVHDTELRAGPPGAKWAYCWITGLTWGWLPETALA